MYTHRITVHGAPFVVEKRLESHDCVSGYSAAKDWAKDVPAQTRRIELYSCDSATGGPFSNAQMLANRTGLPVTGYAGRVSNMDNSPQQFTPQSSPFASFTGKVNDALATVKTCGRNGF
nr:hypothetical protein HUO10_003682 [Paraburkholderia busanensis]